MIDMTTSEGRIHAISQGLTPRRLENAYREYQVRALAQDLCTERSQLTDAARAWGIEHRNYRRKNDG